MPEETVQIYRITENVRNQRIEKFKKEMADAERNIRQLSREN
jgi:hypothetical protein